jgi:uncharacterized membrane protein YcjF (UPF0283 family)
MVDGELLYIMILLTLGFGLTALITSMFEMMRTGFILTLHVVMQFLALGAIAVTWLLYLTNASDLVQYGILATAFLAVLALVVWLGNMFRGLMLFRTMQGSSFHSHVFSHQILFVILSMATLVAV